MKRSPFFPIVKTSKKETNVCIRVLYAPDINAKFLKRGTSHNLGSRAHRSFIFRALLNIGHSSDSMSMNIRWFWAMWVFGSGYSWSRSSKTPSPLEPILVFQCWITMTVNNLGCEFYKLIILFQHFSQVWVAV